MKYAIVTVLDQTIGYYAPNSASAYVSDWTTVHAEAELYDTREAATRAVHEAKAGWKTDKECWIEEVADVAEFTARENTW